MSIHAIGIIALVLVFIIGTVRAINLGALALVMTFLVGTIFAGEGLKDMYSGFPVDLLVLLAGVTYLFAIASNNGTVERIVEGAARLVKDRRALIPWIVFVVASLPAMAGALGSAGVAMLAPLSLRLAKRYDIDRRMIGLMVIHGAAAGNFSPLNVLGAIVTQAVARSGLDMSSSALFLGNLAYNVALAAIIYFTFGGLRLKLKKPQFVPAAAVGARARVAHDFEASPVDIARSAPADTTERVEQRAERLGIDQICTLFALLAVSVAALGFGLNIGFLAFAAAALLQMIFPASSDGADRKIAWSVVLLVCGIVTYVAALQRYGTVQAVGDAIAGLGTPLVAALLICGVGAFTSAFASSAGILGAMIPLAVPFMARGEVGTTGLVVALAISATVVDSTPFSTVGALVVANSEDEERPHIYRGLLLWGAAMVVTAPLLTWLIFIVFAA
ncbi:MAG: C4-dicarboxylate ABC transporter [Blastocatellia bacterium]|nr:C4-dicarboxylate ABC transporter [Blastocatellia bacterium]